MSTAPNRRPGPLRESRRARRRRRGSGGLFFSWLSLDRDLLQALLGPLLDFRGELAGIDELLERFDRPRLPHFDQEIDERDLDEGVALDRQGPVSYTHLRAHETDS